jgi:hypothetical protein
VSTMMLSFGCMGIVTLLWSWIGVRIGSLSGASTRALLWLSCCPLLPSAV